MGNSPFNDEFLIKEDQIDKDMITLPPFNTGGSGWLLATPSTWTFSKMDLSNTDTNSPYSYNGCKSTRTISKNAVASSMELQHQLSLSSYSSPSSIEELDDPFNTWRGSEAPFVEENNSHEGEKCQQRYSEKWDSWFPPGKLESSQILPYDTALSPPCARDSNLSTWNRNFGSANLSDLDISRSPSCLQRSDAVRSRPRTPYGRQQTSRPSYTAFPPMPQRQVYTHEPPHRPHKSWPFDAKPDRPTIRARANTTPSNFKANRPSNLSACTTLNDQSPCSSSSGGTPLYMLSPPTSPFTAPELMTFMSQQSYFFHDDDNNEQEKSWIETQKQKWHTRVSNRGITPSVDEPPRLVPTPKKKKISLGKTTSEALKEIFGMKKHGKVESGKECKNCPKCNKILERGEGGLMVTCWCRADLCFGCLRDWDFCIGVCES